MTVTITQAFDLPAREDITALGFVVRLSEEEDQKLVADYVITPKVAEELPAILKAMRHTFKARTDLGRFVHGSFGSGKSHFLSFLGLMLEGKASSWAKDDPTIRALSGEHRPWLEDAKLLVVRLHMLTTTGGQGSGFDRAVYEAANAALQHRGKAPFEFLNVEGVLSEARREAELFGTQFWKRLEEAGIVGSRDEFEAMAVGAADEREALARALLQWKGRDATTAGVDPSWAVGLRKLCEHVKAQGFGGLVLLVDEFLLWLREKSGPEFERAINQLTVMVDHADGARAVPLFTFVARQRNIEEFFPDLVEERQLHEHLGHHAKRFELTELEDVELRHVCRGRVLRRRPEYEAEVSRVVDALAKDYEKILPSILQQADIGYLRDVYPFHPALIEMLIDVSSLMQRDRTALRLLYELLVIHNADLPLGKLLPVGRAFDAIFPRAGVEGSKRVEDLRAIHRTYYQRFSPAMDKMLRDAEAAKGDFDATRRGVLDTIVKTALLAEVSPRLKGTGSMSIERLVRLNDAEVTGETDRSKFNRVYQDLLDLSRIVPGAIQLSGQGKDASVSVILQGVNFGEILDRARSRVMGQKNVRLRTFYKVLLPALRLKEEKLGEKHDVEWRRTPRRGSVDVENIRELPNAAFKIRPGGEYRILIDYPWDEPGYSVADDEQRAADVRKRDGTSLTACWLPRHFTQSELAFLDDLAALEELTGSAQEELIRDFGPNERAQIVEQANNQAQNLRQSLQQKLGEVYRDHGRIVALTTGIEATVPAGELGEIIDRLARVLLDRQYPMHPAFGAKPEPETLRLLCDWLARAAEKQDQMEVFTDEEAKVLRTLGDPLELVSMGQTRAQLRLDTRYIKTVREEAKGESVLWDGIDRKLQETYALTPIVRNFFLKLLSRLDSFRVVHAVHGDLVDVEIDSKSRTQVKLVRAPLLDLPEWSRARELGPALFKAMSAPSATRTLSEQDRFARELHACTAGRRGQLQGLHERLVKDLGANGKRVEELKVAIARLAPLAKQPSDSCAVLRDWLKLWPDDTSDPVRTAVVRIGDVSAAIEKLDETVRLSLRRATNGPLGAEVQAHLDALRGLADAGEQERPLTEQAIQKWNETGKSLLHRVLEHLPPSPPPVQGGGTPGQPPPAEPHATGPSAPKTIAATFAASSGAERDRLIQRVRSELDELADDQVDVAITITRRGR